MNFSDTDLLDAMMRAAFKPSTEPYAMYDSNGNVKISYTPSASLIDPIIQVIRKKIEDDEEFRQRLINELIQRMDVIADAIVGRVISNESAFGIAQTGSSFNGSSINYKLADWLQEPLGEALAVALTKPLVKHFTKEGSINPANVQLNVSVEVHPWPKS